MHTNLPTTIKKGWDLDRSPVGPPPPRQQRKGKPCPCVGYSAKIKLILKHFHDYNFITSRMRSYHLIRVAITNRFCCNKISYRPFSEIAKEVNRVMANPEINGDPVPLDFSKGRAATGYRNSAYSISYDRIFGKEKGSGSHFSDTVEVHGQSLQKNSEKRGAK